jgi:molybdopterin/thiamine biosynthesis adenylyltransferase
MSLSDFLAATARNGLLSWSAEREAARSFDLDAGKVEAAALAMGILPARYARNAGTVGLAGQAKLHAARVAVAGCGGIGGYVIEHLARLGIGTIVAVDPDTFEESNLNRQILATVENLGIPKVEAAALRAGALNPAVVLRPVCARLDSRNAPSILKGIDVVADGLDTISARLELAEACAKLGLPFVHASVAGWYAQASTQAPGSSALSDIYGAASAHGDSTRGVEVTLGNPSFTPALAASIEAAEVCKILLGLSGTLRGRLLHFDLLAMESSEFPI